MTLEATPTTRVELDYSGGERLTMNMGPQHPSAHGVFRAILTLEGETVVGVDAVIGYLHRCHEKLSETLTYAQYPSIASKTDYVAAMTSEFAYVMAAEQIGKIEVPKRAQYLRVIAAELQRIASHLLWLGTWCMDMGGALGGGATIFLYAIRERETILDLFESLVGARLLYGFYQVGGTRYDIPPGWADACRKTIDVIDQFGARTIQLRGRTEYLCTPTVRQNPSTDPCEMAGNGQCGGTCGPGERCLALSGEECACLPESSMCASSLTCSEGHCGGVWETCVTLPIGGCGCSHPP